MKLSTQHLAMGSMAVSIIAAGIASHAPENLSWLWAIKTVADVFGASGLAALCLQPPTPKP